VGRFLFVVPPLEGHTNPTVAVGRELMGRGHAVGWTGYPEVTPALLPASAAYIPVAARAPQAVVDAMAVRSLAPPTGAAGFRSFWEEFVLPIGRDMVPGTTLAVQAFAPDVVVADQHALAGAAVALRAGLVWATSATSSADLVDPLAGIPKVGEWLRRRMRGLLVEAGVDETTAARVDPRFSPHLVLGFTTNELVGATEPFPVHWALVGPAVGVRPDGTPFPWDWLAGDRPVVLVTLGTVNWRAGARFFAVAAEALGLLDVQVVMAAPPEVVPDPPPNVLVVPQVPQLAVLRRVDLVICHGGHNTVCEALAAGVPLVVAAVRDDQPFVADQVVRAGAGVRVRFGRVTVADLRAAVGTVLGDPGYREAAARLRAAFARAGGAPAAADRLAALLAPAGAGEGAPT
jgi:MGT family glycosyltransferase